MAVRLILKGGLVVRMVLLLMSEGTKWWAVRSKLQVSIWASSMALQAEVSAASNQPQAKELCTGLERSFFTRQSIGQLASTATIETPLTTGSFIPDTA